MLDEEVARVLEGIKGSVSKGTIKTVELPGKPGGSATARRVTATELIPVT